MVRDVAPPVALDHLGPHRRRVGQDVGRVGADPERVGVRVLHEEQVVVGGVLVDAVLEGEGVLVADPSEPTDVEGAGARHRG